MKILCSADWHLDAPMAASDESLRAASLALPGKLADLCKQENCDLVLLSGDIFDGAYTADSLNALRTALREMAVPVFISPGNHDFVGATSPWLTEKFPENVHIYTAPRLESVYLPDHDLTVWGAGYTSMDCEGLLENFHAGAGNHICVLHADPTVATSPYCPVSRSQVEDSNLKLLALGHIHKGGSFTAGSTLCLWPGCPMGRGYDETGEKGAVIVDLDTAQARFVPLATPRFFDLTCTPAELPSLLPAAGSSDYYRITFEGESDPIDLSALRARYAHFPHLLLRDRTVAPLDIWGSAGEDSFEGTYFGLLRQALEEAGPEDKETVLLAARLSRQLLEGQEVRLP